MKVLVFTSLYPNNIWPNHGVFVKERMTHFAQLNGREVKVIAPVPYYPPISFGSRQSYSRVLRREMRDGLEVHHPRYFMTPKIGMTLYGFLMFLSVLPNMRRVRKAYNFDLIDAHYVYPDGYAGVLLGRYFGRPVVVSARGSDINLYANFPVIRRFLRYTLEKADRVIAVCTALKEAIVKLNVPDGKVLVIPNGVDGNKFHPFPKEEARRKLGIPGDKRVILSVGGLIPRKGFDLLIKALSILLKQARESNLHLVIVGDGESRPELEQLVSSHSLNDHVVFAGSVPHQDLFLWYSAADLFCLASSREGWPNVLLEALACGTPVIATNVWGAPEIIPSEDIGLLTERDETAIAAKISLALNRSWVSGALVEYARRHTWDRTALSVHEAFESVLDTSRIARQSTP